MSASTPNQIELLVIVGSGPDNPPVIIKGKKVKVLQIFGNNPVEIYDTDVYQFSAINSTRVTLISCFIGSISMVSMSGRIQLGDQVVDVAPWAFEDLDILGGCIYRIRAPAFIGGGSTNHFMGSVRVKGLYLPRTARYSLTPASDMERRHRLYEYRNIRNYLQKKNDQLSAGVFHAAELTLERKDDTIPFRIFGWLYDIGSDYGNSVTAPLFWFSISYFLYSLYILLFNSVIIPECLKENPNLVGWQAQLCTENWLKASAFPIYSILGVLNYFSSNPLMISENWKAALVHLLFSTCLIALLGLFVAALRRRFKIEISAQ